MIQKKSKESDPKVGRAGADDLTSARLYSRKEIAKHFKRTADLTTIQLTETILYKPRDLDRGAALFCERIRYLLDHAPKDRKPVFIWLVRDIDQLHYVVEKTKAKDARVFDQLVEHAVYGEAVESASFYRDLVPDRAKTEGTLHSALTASLLSDETEGRHYAYYGHFSPEASGESWKNGPHCEVLSAIPESLERLIDDLHQAHAELVGAERPKPGNAAEQLANDGISIARMENLID